MNEQYIQSVVKSVEKIKDFLLVFVGISKTLVKPARILSLLFSLGERRERRGSDLTQYYRREHHRGLPSGPKNEPKYTLTNQIGLCPCSNSIVRGHSSLESPRECLYHVRLPCRYLGGWYHTFGAWGPPSGPKNEPKYAQTNQIGL